jgi:hypothetical protein
MQVKDTKAEAKTVIGNTANLGHREMNAAALQDLESRIN